VVYDDSAAIYDLSIYWGGYIAVLRSGALEKYVAP
jgi:hypothetical protein